MSGIESGRRHTRDDVARTALRILDDHGLPDLTMRRLAAALDVQPSALYWHFPNKQSLLAELADRIVAGPSNSAAPAPDGEWMEAVRTEAAALRDALLAYRDGAEVVASTLALGLGSGVALDRLTRAVARGGFDEATARRAATALLHFVLGHVSHEQQRLQYDSLGVLADPADPVAAGVGVGGEKADDPAADFAFGVDLFAGGLERLRAGELSRPRR
ncbi:TetR/AcrR family transcriptional regulator C-terminal domain-containing protein [Leifsonia aquatica]|uniref:TetR/AcrR family transcriptional regulator C-terminal domain-containing protein n=1 Tax=Leifsonia aquatica TaxID=144185 RepID=UPI0028A9D739|nr:TetR/AcrR family transcriptional regulator C-terminal domain-containing protein [Leifsonia aquatica]